MHGKTPEEHDQRLLKVLRTLVDAGLSLNREKCQFSINQLEFMGHLISHRGIGPTLTQVGAMLMPETRSTRFPWAGQRR